MRKILGQYAPAWFLFGAVETALIAAGCTAALFYRYSDSEFSSLHLTALALLLSLAVVALMHSVGLYQGHAVRDLKRTLSRAAVIAVPVFVLAVWTTGELASLTKFPIYPYRWQWTGALTGSWLMLAIFLRLILRQVYDSGILTRKIVVVGTAGQAAELVALARKSDERFRIVAQFDPRIEDVESSVQRAMERFSKPMNSEIVVAINDQPLPWNLLVRCRLAGYRVTDYLDFYEREARRIRIDILREDWIAMSRGFDCGPGNGRQRRMVDVLLAVAGIVAAAPVLLLTALAIKLEDGGSVLFRQERVGLGGKSFTLLKFRSMREDAERDGLPAWASEGDARVTRVGRFIRKVRIDELPQFWNVLRGDMTVIGPRPERPYFVQQFSQAIPYYDYRHTVRPGITGWAQVSFRYGASLDDTWRKLSYDLYYVKNRGFLLDALILLKTIGVVLRGQGAR